MQLNEMLEEESVQNSIPYRLKILKQITETRNLYGQLLHKGPMVLSIDKVIQKSSMGNFENNRYRTA